MTPNMELKKHYNFFNLEWGNRSGHTKTHNRVPANAVGASDEGSDGQRAEHQRLLSVGGDKQKRIFLLAAEVTESSL